MWEIAAAAATHGLLVASRAFAEQTEIPSSLSSSLSLPLLPTVNKLCGIFPKSAAFPASVSRDFFPLLPHFFASEFRPRFQSLTGKTN